MVAAAVGGGAACPHADNARTTGDCVSGIDDCVETTTAAPAGTPAKCASMSQALCSKGFALHSARADQECGGRECTAADSSTCCVPTCATMDERDCGRGYLLDLRATTRVHRRCGGSKCTAADSAWCCVPTCSTMAEDDCGEGYVLDLRPTIRFRTRCASSKCTVADRATCCLATCAVMDVELCWEHLGEGFDLDFTKMHLNCDAATCSAADVDTCCRQQVGMSAAGTTTDAATTVARLHVAATFCSAAAVVAVAVTAGAGGVVAWAR